MEGHVSVKWAISRVTITATSRFDKRSKMPVDVPERVSSPVTTRTCIVRNDRYVVIAWSRYTLSDRYLSRTTFAQSRAIVNLSFFRARTWTLFSMKRFLLLRFSAVRHMRRTRTNVAFQIHLCTLRARRSESWKQFRFRLIHNYRSWKRNFTKKSTLHKLPLFLQYIQIMYISL